MSPAAPRTAPWGAVLAALVLAICWLAFDPAPPSSVDTGWDKANHALAFAVLAVVAQRGFPGAGVLRLLAWGVAYGAFIEIVQSRIPGRSAEWADVVADTAGVLVGLALATLARRLRPH